MRFPGGAELPADLEAVHRRAVRLEWLSIAYLLSAITAIYFTLGSSQAMKGAWLEDLMSLLPPIAFLVAARIRYRAPDRDHPFGHHRAVEVAYLCAALALLFMGTFLIVDSVLKLLGGDHPSIGMVELFDWQLWLGWLMLAALAWSVFPALVLGRLKIRLAAQLHDKVLYADAQMNKADWMTGAAAMAGVVGIGLGLWWADAVAAILIGLDIFHDGAKHTRAAGRDLLDGRPRRYDEGGEHPLAAEIERVVGEAGWIEEAAVRVRDTGHVFNVSVLVVPRDGEDLVARCEALAADVRELDWKVQEAVVAPVAELEDAPADLLVRPAQGRFAAAGE